MTAGRSADERQDDRLIASARHDAEPDVALVRLLDERARHHRGRSTASTNRLRARVLVELGEVGLPSAAMPFVLEELEQGLDPSTVAAAGRALLSAAGPLPADVAPLLVAAVERLRGNDDVVAWHPSSTALEVLAGTIEQLGPAAAGAHRPLAAVLATHHCCFSDGVRTRLEAALDAVGDGPTSPCCDEAPPAPTTSAADLRALVLEDQDGHLATFADRFEGRTTALSFFYTRCTNPQRCSLTVARLAGLARRLDADGVGTDVAVAGISYDPRYDRPQRLRVYGADRGMSFSSRCSLLRTTGPFEPLIEALALGVGYGPVTVNQHRLDLVVLDPELRVRAHRTRRLWSEADVLADLLQPV